MENGKKIRPLSEANCQSLIRIHERIRHVEEKANDCFYKFVQHILTLSSLILAWLSGLFLNHQALPPLQLILLVLTFVLLVTTLALGLFVLYSESLLWKMAANALHHKRKDMVESNPPKENYHSEIPKGYVICARIQCCTFLFSLLLFAIFALSNLRIAQATATRQNDKANLQSQHQALHPVISGSHKVDAVP